jgi:AcrR family transcriptional regulator
MALVDTGAGRDTSGPQQDSDVEARIKKAAIVLAAEGGFSALSVGAICAGAGVSEAAFRQHWPDAWAVVLDALDERLRAPTLPDEGSLADDLVAYAKAYHHRCSDPVFTAFLFQLLAATKSDVAC